MTEEVSARSRLSLCCAVLLALCHAAAAGGVGERPNIVLIMVDDLGWGDLGVYGQQLILTPEIDAMAAEGLRLTHFYAAAPHCHPSRNSLLTGLHTGHTHIRRDGHLTADDPILPELLHAAGYATGMYGKWGLSEVDAGDTPVLAVPHELGFDRFTGQLTHRDAHVYFLDSPPHPPGTPEHPFYPDIRQFLYQSRDGRTEMLALPPQRYVHDEFVDRTLGFIDEHRHEPFFLYLPYTIPHAELVVPADSLALYLDEQGQSLFPEIPWTPPLDGRGFDRHNPMPRATYAAMISRLSRDVGRILQRLRDHGLEEDTLVILTSDNGPHDAGGIASPDFFASSGGLSGMKWSLSEGGIRVPMIAWWPGTITPGVSDQPAALWDLLPTLADLTATPLAGRVDGISLRPLLTGEGSLPRRFLYWEAFVGGATYRQAARLGRYKALRRVADDHVELYDLVSDPAERSDLSGLPELCPQLLELKEILNTARVSPPRNPEHRFDIAPLSLRCAPDSVCTPDATTLCLRGGRFRVEVEWQDFSGGTGAGRQVPSGSDESGLFWFFDADNWELLVKVLDGCPLNDRFWVFAAATTNVGTTLRVTDTVSGQRQVYVNPLGTPSAAVTDTAAFATCGDAVD